MVTHSELSVEVREVLRQHGEGLLARDIANWVRFRTGGRVDRRDINRVLYGVLAREVLVSPAFRWRLAGASAGTGRSPYVAPRSQPPDADQQGSATSRLAYEIGIYLNQTPWFKTPLANPKCRNVVFAGYRETNPADQGRRVLECVGLLDLGEHTAAGRALSDDYAGVVGHLAKQTRGGTMKLNEGLKGEFLVLKVKGRKARRPVKYDGRVISDNSLAFYLQPAFIARFLADAEMVKH